jgi:hypothetical protein
MAMLRFGHAAMKTARGEQTALEPPGGFDIMAREY